MSECKHEETPLWEITVPAYSSAATATAYCVGCDETIEILGKSDLTRLLNHLDVATVRKLAFPQ